MNKVLHHNSSILSNSQRCSWHKLVNFIVFSPCWRKLSAFPSDDICVDSETADILTWSVFLYKRNFSIFDFWRLASLSGTRLEKTNAYFLNQVARVCRKRSYWLRSDPCDHHSLPTRTACHSRERALWSRQLLYILMISKEGKLGYRLIIIYLSFTLTRIYIIEARFLSNWVFILWITNRFCPKFCLHVCLFYTLLILWYDRDDRDHVFPMAKLKSMRRSPLHITLGGIRWDKIYTVHCQTAPSLM